MGLGYFSASNIEPLDARGVVACAKKIINKDVSGPTDALPVFTTRVPMNG